MPAESPCPQCGTSMEVREATDLEEFTCPKCGSSLSRKVNPVKPLTSPVPPLPSPECPQCKVPLKPLASEKNFEEDRQIWECEQCGYQIDLFKDL